MVILPFGEPTSQYILKISFRQIVSTVCQGKEDTMLPSEEVVSY